MDAGCAVATPVMRNIPGRRLNLPRPRRTPAMPTNFDDNSARNMHERWTKRAIELAVTGARAGHGRPFGAVVVQDGRMVAEAYNEVLKQNDPTAHAELIAVRRAAAALGTRDLSSCDIYVNGMPCPMCYSGIYWSRMRKIYYGCTAEQLAAIIGIDDGELYADLARPPASRQHLPAEQVPGAVADAIACYQAWGPQGHTRGK
jgi:guanine deaminase